MNSYRQTTDASGVYHEWAPNNVARSHSAAQEGNLSSFTKNNTLVVSEMVLVIIYVPRIDVHPVNVNENVVIDFVSRSSRYDFVDTHADS